MSHLPLQENKIPISINNSRRSALVIVDDESLLNYFCTSLKNEGYTTRGPSNWDEALRLYQECRPFSVVLVDYCVAGMRGVQIATEIRRIDPSQSIILAAFDYRNEDEVPRPRELSDVPLLTDVRDFRLRRLLVRQALEKLGKKDLRRIRSYAIHYLRALGRAAGRRSYGDLIDQAIFETMVGSGSAKKGRHWNPNVDLVRHLRLAMQSIADHWGSSFNPMEYLASEIVIDPEDNEGACPIESAVSEEMLPDERLFLQEEEKLITKTFEDDPEATWVINGIWQGMKPGEILKHYGLTRSEYESAVDRIRRKLYWKVNRKGGMADAC